MLQRLGENEMQSRAIKTRHFTVLDGLRGVAAMMVFGGHIELTQHVRGVFSHSHLAVDFFFVLSGFVIGHAYENKLATGKLSLREFAFTRWVRLYPMMFLGALLGLAAALIHPVPAPLALAFLAQALFLPLFDGDTSLYLLNPVQWSLLFEGLANAGHAISLKWLSNRALVGLCLVGFGLLAFFQVRHQAFDAGFSANTFKRGAARILFGYTAGLLLYRIHAAGRLPQIRTPFWLASVLLCCVMIGCACAERFQFAELLGVATFPAIVWASLGAEPARWEAKIADWLGRSSYPLYATHWPILALCGPLLPHSPWTMIVALPVGLLLSTALDPIDAWTRRKIAALPAQRLAPIAARRSSGANAAPSRPPSPEVK
jgi:peptidoglycan/LPS O-acetylase OafA/YrhL